MQPAYYNDLDEIHKKIWDMITEGVKNRHHQFHIPVVVNSNEKGFDGRIVVLRKADRDKKIIRFHSDIRSPKVKNFQKDSKVVFIFYDKEEKIQLRISGKSNVNYDNDITEDAWKNTSFMSRQCYLAKYSPGTESDIPTSGLTDKVENLGYSIEDSESGYENFCVIETKINTIEWLYLAAKGHRRAKFNYRDGNKKIWLTP